MPNSSTSEPSLAVQIAELERKSSLQKGLSTANAGHLRKLKLWSHFAGKDVVMVVQPVGALALPADLAPKARFVEVHDMVAADLLAFAMQRQQLVRVATESEVKVYRAQCAWDTAMAARRKATAIQTALQAQMAAALGQPAGSGGAAPPGPLEELGDRPENPTLESAEIQSALQSHAAKAEALQVGDVQKKPSVPSVDDMLKGTAGAELAPDMTVGTGATIPAELVSLVKPSVAAAMAASGFTTNESVAASSPQELAKVHGIGEATAAKLMTAAGDALDAASKAGAGDSSDGGAAGDDTAAE